MAGKPGFFAGHEMGWTSVLFLEVYKSLLWLKLNVCFGIQLDWKLIIRGIFGKKPPFILGD
jgi:hypothetical protein